MSTKSLSQNAELMNQHGSPKGVLHYSGFAFLPAAGAMVAVWIIVIAFSLAERNTVLERAETQLRNTISTLADFSQLSEIESGRIAEADPERSAAIWRALLQYPSAFIWIETRGTVSAGQQPEADLGTVISATEKRGDITVHAVLPVREALSGWRRSLWRRGTFLLLTSIAFAFLVELLARALRQRAVADREAAKAQERADQLAVHRAKLEETVAQRTQELKQSNSLLETELKERKAAENTLREHDALLNVVTKSAAELLGTHNLDEGIDDVLELIGQTIGVRSAQLNMASTGEEGHLRFSLKYEWCAPGVSSLITNPMFQNLDVSLHLPKVVALLRIGELTRSSIGDVEGPGAALFEKAGMRSFLQLPVLIEGKLWGVLVFVDASGDRQWTWAESDTLQILSELIGMAITRDRYVKELADAHMIVQNSPTILYRFRGEPSLPLIYISHNITKFGYSPDHLLKTPDSYMDMIDPADQAATRTAMEHFLEKDFTGASIEFRLVTGNGTRRWVETRYTPVRDKDGRLVEIEGIMIDITERKAAEDKIAQLARTDPLTGLANRSTFVDRLHQLFIAAQRSGGTFAVLYLDLDHFKDINDTLGHPVGDALLKEAAQRLEGCVRENDLVARLGGDEFAVLQTDMNDPANAGSLAAKIMESLTAPYKIEGNDLHITTSIGIAAYSPSTESSEEMLSQADLALYRAKEEGRNGYRFHSVDLDHQVRERMTLADDLRKAIENDELELQYQPQVELSSGRIVGMEALVRWNHPERGLLYPRVFLPVAEKSGSIMAVGQWVLNSACRQMKSWRDKGIAPPVMAINLSLSQLKTGRDLIEEVGAAIRKWDLSYSDLEFDVTEATLAQATWSQNDVLAQLRQLGAKVALDDFGTEYSSFDYLRTYKVTHLKIAQPYIEQAMHDSERAATIHAILTLARELGIDVIAEGVESKEQRAFLASIGAGVRAQGFYFSQPVSSSAAAQLLRNGQIHPEEK